MAGEKLVGLIKQGARGAIPPSSLTDIIFGKVTSINPLKILIENKFEVDSRFLILSPFCLEKKVNDLVIWEGLNVNDKVSIIRFASGQKYYVLDRGVE